MTHRGGAGPAPSTARSAGLLYGASLAGAVLSLGNVLITARALAPSGRGAVAFLTTVATLTSALAVMGVQQAVANLGANHPGRSPELAGTSAALSLVLGAAGAGVVVLLVLAVPAARAGASPPLLAMVLAALPLLVLQVCLQQLVAAHYRFGVLTVASLIAPVVNLAANGLLAATGHLTVARAVQTWLAGQLLATGLLASTTVRHLGGFGRPSVRSAREALSFGIRAHLGRVMMLGNYRLDQWLLGGLAGSTQLGLYSAAVAWSEGLFLLPTALSAVQRPDLVRARPEEAGHQATQAFRLAVLATVPLMVCVGLLAPVLCVTMLGEQFVGSVLPLRLLVLGAPGIIALKVLGNALIAQGRALRESAASGAAFVSMLTADVLLIPAWGGTGAAVASTIGYSVGGLVAVGVFLRSLPGTSAAHLVPRLQDASLLVRLAHSRGRLAPTTATPRPAEPAPQLRSASRSPLSVPEP